MQQHYSSSVLEIKNQISNPLQRRVCRYRLFDSPLDNRSKTLSSNDLALYCTGHQQEPLIQHRKMTSVFEMSSSLDRPLQQ